MKPFILILSLLTLLLFSSCRQHSSGTAETGNTGDELAMLTAAIEKNEKDPSLLIRRAKYYTEHQKLNDALLDLNRALELDSRNSGALLDLSNVYILMGKPQQALDALNRLVELNPGKTDGYLKKAQLYLVMKDYENCANSVEKVLELDPRNADAYYIKGVVLDENKQPAKAVEAFRKAVLYNPKQYDALMQLGYAFTDSNPAMAIDYFSSASRADTSSIEALYNLGMLYQDKEDADKALSCYSRMLKLEPDNKLALYNSGYVKLVLQDNYTSGIDFFNRAIGADSAFADAYFNRGYCYELIGDLPKASADYQKVLKLRVNDPKAVQGINRLEKKQRGK